MVDENEFQQDHQEAAAESAPEGTAPERDEPASDTSDPEPAESSESVEEETDAEESNPEESNPEETEPVEASPVEATDDPTDAEPSEPAADTQAEPEPEPAPARRSRRSASRPAGPPVHVEPLEAPAAESTGTAAAATHPEPTADESGTPAPTASETPEPPAESAAPARRHRRATRGVTTVAFSATAEEAPVAVLAPSGAPAVALFQPPDETQAAPRKRKRATKKKDSDVEATEESADASVQEPTADAAAETTEAPESAATETPEEPQADAADVAEDAEEAGQDDETGPRRRRRRGGRRRRRPGGAADADQDETSTDDATEGDADAETPEGPADAESAAQADDESDSEGNGSKRRRRRRRRAGVSEEMEDLSSDDVTTVVKVREGRRSSSPNDEITALRGSARIEAKKQRRRDGREAGRRRAPILTEAEFLARRESVDRVMCVRELAGRTQIAVLEDGVLAEHYVSRQQAASMVGNVYLGRVQNVLPSMEAAFVDIGRGRNAVLYAGEVNWDAAGLDGQPKRIEFALKSGDPVLVQVTKDPIGHKGARLTSQISLPGRFVVYVPEGSMTGISRKLPDTERARLKSVLKEVVPDGAGVIVRTAAEGASEEQLTADVQRLTAQWTEITKKSGSASPPTLLYAEPDLAIKVARDIFNEDFKELIVQGESTWSTLQEYVGWVAPDLMGKLRKWVEPTDLYKAHRIDEQLAKALDRKVWLPSGGSLVIDRTEAMTVVDVNTGKFTGQGGNLEETVTKNNLEAAEEIVRQLRLRDIGGIIVVDFIDMVLESNRDLVLRRLLECLGRDRTRHQVAEVTSLGLVQMTRKRIGQGLLEVFSTPCEHCGGRGHVVHTEPIGEDPQVDEPNVRGGRDRGRSRGGRPAATAPVHLGGRQTGKTPPPPKFDEHGHIDHSGEASEPPRDEATPAELAAETEPIEFEGDLEPVERDYDEETPAEAPEAPAQGSPAADHPEHLDREAV